MTKRVYKERRLYFSENCGNCGKPYQSFKRSKIKHGLCRKCRKSAVDPNQAPLFDMFDRDHITIEGEQSIIRIGKQEDGTYGIRRVLKGKPQEGVTVE